MTPEKKAAIREALKAATPGPWKVSDSHGLCVAASAKLAPLVADMSTKDWEGDRADAHLIANAPTWLAELLEELEEAERQAAMWHEQHMRFSTDYDALHDQRCAEARAADSARAEVARLQERVRELEDKPHGPCPYRETSKRVPALERQVAVLRVALEKYGQHGSETRRHALGDVYRVWCPEEGRCFCGLSAALQSTQPKESRDE